MEAIGYLRPFCILLCKSDLKVFEASFLSILIFVCFSCFEWSSHLNCYFYI